MKNGQLDIGFEQEVLVVPAAKKFKHQKRGWMKWERLSIHEKINLRSWSKWCYGYLSQFLEDETMLTENHDPEHHLRECHMYLEMQEVITRNKIWRGEQFKKFKRSKAVKLVEGSFQTECTLFEISFTEPELFEFFNKHHLSYLD